MTDSQPDNSAPLPYKSILVVDLSNAFWGVALGGNLANVNSARDIVCREIRTRAANYDRTAIAVDGRKPSFRAKLWKDYKADRPSRPPHLWSLLDDTIRHLDSAGFHIFHAPETEERDCTFEADDVIGSIVAWHSERGIPCDILSGDSDLTQLVDDTNRVRMIRSYYDKRQRCRVETTLNAAGVFEWLKVYPQAVAELKALAGDQGDGYGNTFPGIGEDTAIELLKVSEWSARKGVEKVVSAVREYHAKIEAGEKLPKSAAPSKKRETIAELGIDRLEIGYALAIVCKTLPLDFDALREKREPRPLPELGANMLPPEPEAAPASDDTSDQNDEPEPPAVQGEIVQPPAQTAAIVTVDPTARMLVSPAEARQRIKEFQALIKAVLIPNVDYGKIKGCGDKPVLLKSGAEKLAEVYGLAPYFTVQKSIERWNDEDPLFFYRVACHLKRKSDGIQASECVGSCNSRETKYAARWEFADKVPEHLELSRLKKKVMTLKWDREGVGRKGDRVEQYSVPNPAIYDQVNTILKMAQKRAFIGSVLFATRASGEFMHDVDDIPLDALGVPNPNPQWET